MKAKDTKQKNGGVTKSTLSIADVLDQADRRIFELCSDGIATFSPAGELLDASENLSRMLGYRRDELVAHPVSNIFDKSSLDWLESVLRDGGQPREHVRIKLLRKDSRPIASKVAALMLPDGNMLAIFWGAAQDETDSSRLAAIVESSDDAIVGKDLNGIVSSWNAGAERIFGYTADEMIGTPISRLLPDDRKDEENRILEKIRHGEKIDHFQTVRITRDRRLIDVSVTISPIRDSTGRIVGASKIARDITQLVARERHARKISRLYDALAQINQALMRTKSRDGLFRESCRLLADVGGMEMAWLGRLDADTHRQVAVAAHGGQSGKDAMARFRGWLEGQDRDRGAFRGDRPYVCNDMQEARDLPPRHAQLVRQGLRAFAAFPIKEHGKVAHVLNVCASQQGLFQEEETLLLQEVAGDLSFALERLEHEEARRQSEMAVRSEKSFSDMLIESMPGIVYLIDEQRRFVRWNKNFSEVTGHSDAEIGQMHPLDFVAVEERPFMERKIAEVFEAGEADAEAALLARSGKQTSFMLIGRRIVSGGRPCLLGIGIDISRRKAYEKQVEEQDRTLKQMSAIAHIGGWEFDPVTGKGIWTEEVARIHEVDPAAETSASYGLGFYRGEHRHRIEAAVQEALAQGKPYDLELELVTASGRRKWVRTIGDPVVRGGKVVKMRGTIQDITERKMAERKIGRLNRVLSVLSRINSLIVRVQDRNELFAEACNIATEEGGFLMAMLAVVDRAGRRILPAAFAGMNDELRADIQHTVSSPERVATTMIGQAVRDGKPVVANDSPHDPAIVFGRIFREAGVRSIAVLPLIVSETVVGTFVLFAAETNFFLQDEMQLLGELTHDIAFAIDHINKAERINYLAYYDALTGLANRNLFLERVEQSIRRAGPGKRQALFLIDIERFKSINDSLGQAAGDALLVQFAHWLTDHVSDASQLARIGADHFAVVMPEAGRDGSVARMIERILDALQGKSFAVNDTELRIAVRIGIALFPDDGGDAETLFSHAEAALKMARRGGNRYLLHTKSMTESVAAALSMENRLRKAIDNEEFVLHYQPKVHHESGKVVAVEALIRWQESRENIVPPEQFIPILEETGMIYEVGHWALRSAIAEGLRWLYAGYPSLRIAVNVSPMQLKSPGFVEEIERNIGIDPQAANILQLELTESTIMENVMHSIEVLQAIRAMGVTISIDDFGTGYSSLGQLGKLPLDELKIDRSFVIKMTEGPKHLALVSTIINLAHSLNLKVVAEGVETEEQARLLGLLACDEIQGYLYGKPVPAEIFEEKFRGMA